MKSGSLLNNPYFMESIQPIFHITQKSHTIMRFLKGGTSSKNGGSSTFSLWIWLWFPQKLVTSWRCGRWMTPSIWQKVTSWPKVSVTANLQPSERSPQMGVAFMGGHDLKKLDVIFLKGTPLKTNMTTEKSLFLIGDTSSNGWFSSQSC